jgi:penicillin-binding protein 2
VTESRVRIRMKVLAGLVVFMFGALTTRLWFLQVLATDEFLKQADDNQVRLVPIQPLRGQILDRDGKVLIGNRASTVVTIDRKLVPADQIDGVLFRLSELLHVPVQDMADRMTSVKYLPYQPIPIAEDVSKEAVFYIKEHSNLFPGVEYRVDSIRDYQQGDLAAHLMGSAGEISAEQLKEPDFVARGYRPGDIVGKGGVEAVYEEWLHGTSGTRGIQVNAQGRVLDPDFGSQPPTPGDNVILSLDSKVQKLAEQSLELGIRVARQTQDDNGAYFKATGGAAIVMDPKNGQIVAMASNPSFDPSIFQGGVSKKEFAALTNPRNGQPLLNRAIAGVYPAGSTFKPFIAAAALKEGFASPNGFYNCPRDYEVPIDPTHRKFHNWEPVDHGPITLAQALIISCDTVFYQFGFDFWQKYFRSGNKNELMQKDLFQMGFGQRTGIDLPGEQPGRIPTEAYERKIYKAYPKVFGRYYGWVPGDSVNLSIGQGFLLVTPLQLAMAYSAIANGGRILQPHIGLKIQTAEGKTVEQIRSKLLGRLPISKAQVAYLRQALTGVPEQGTAQGAFAGFPFGQVSVAGKTGTADIPPNKQPFSWFAAMAPAGGPRYVVVAMVEQAGHGSTTAAPVVRRILEGLFGIKSTKLVTGATVD